MWEHVRFYRFITPIYPRCVIAAKFRENWLYRGYSLTRVLRSCLKIDVYELRVGTQLRRPALRGHQGLQQIGGLPAGRLLRGQPIPEQLERRVRRGRVAIRPV